MKNILAITAVILLGGVIGTTAAAAETFPKEYTTEGTITFEAGDDGVTPPVDPEKPDPTNPVDPTDPPGPGTGGALSIDYGSKFKFGPQKISTADKTYYAAPDEMKDGSTKPTYVQITDRRGTLDGWKLSISQPKQFETTAGDELEGAQLKLTKGAVASSVDGKYTPTNVSSEIVLTPGQSNALAVNAKKGTGVGTWVYRFGSDTADNADAVQLFVPGESVKLAQQYSTQLVWTLENTPDNS